MVLWQGISSLGHRDSGALHSRFQVSRVPSTAICVCCSFLVANARSPLQNFLFDR